MLKKKRQTSKERYSRDILHFKLHLLISRRKYRHMNIPSSQSSEYTALIVCISVVVTLLRRCAGQALCQKPSDEERGGNSVFRELILIQGWRVNTDLSAHVWDTTDSVVRLFASFGAFKNTTAPEVVWVTFRSCSGVRAWAYGVKA